jgi:hypothetical protein
MFWGSVRGPIGGQDEAPLPRELFTECDNRIRAYKRLHPKMDA